MDRYTLVTQTIHRHWIYFRLHKRTLIASYFVVSENYFGPSIRYRFIQVHEHSLQWRHNEPDCVSNHQLHDCLLNRLFRRRSKKTSKLRVTGLDVENTGEFPTQMASNAEKFPFHDVIMFYHITQITFLYGNTSDTVVFNTLPIDLLLTRAVRVTAGRVKTTFGFLTRTGIPFIRTTSLQDHCAPAGISIVFTWFFVLFCNPYSSELIQSYYSKPLQWWRHQMKTFSALLALCAENSPVTGEFPAQKPVTRSFGVFCAWINGYVNNREVDDFRRHRAHYDVIAMWSFVLFCNQYSSELIQRYYSKPLRGEIDGI